MAIEVIIVERIQVPENGHQLMIDVEKLASKTVVGEPPRTPEGDFEGLAAVERIGTMYPSLDEKTTKFIAESDELSLDYKFWLREGM
jgi:hypothetical protein